MFLSVTDINFKVSASSPNIVDFSNRFMFLHFFGLKVDELTIDLFEDSKNCIHFSKHCSYKNGRFKKLTSVNAVEFYGTVASSKLVPSFEDEAEKQNFAYVETVNEVTAYCFCYMFQSLSMLDGVLSHGWLFPLKSVSNMLLFTDTPIVNFKHFKAVSYAFDDFKRAFDNLSFFFETHDDSLLEKVITMQTFRLEEARKLFLNDLSLVINEFKLLTNDEELLNVLNTCSLTKMKVAPFSAFLFASDKNVKVANSCKHFLNLIGFLFIEKDVNFFVVPEVFMTLWEKIINKLFETSFSSEFIEVSNFNDFVETLNSLCPSLFSFNEGGFASSSFDMVKFYEVVNSAGILADSE